MPHPLSSERVATDNRMILFFICLFFFLFTIEIFFPLGSYFFFFFLNLPVVCRFELYRAHFLLQLLEYNEQRRNDEQQGERSDQHTADSTCSQRTVTVCTYTGRYN